jgi:hypothetical protein
MTTKRKLDACRFHVLGFCHGRYCEYFFNELRICYELRIHRHFRNSYIRIFFVIRCNNANFDDKLQFFIILNIHTIS